MTIGPAPLCLSCTHYRGGLGESASDDYENFAAFGCDAFPRGIPIRFFTSMEDHLTPVEGDGGIVFEDDGTTSPFRFP